MEVWGWESEWQANGNVYKSQKLDTSCAIGPISSLQAVCGETKWL